MIGRFSVEAGAGRRLSIGLAIALLVIGLDQYSKYLVVSDWPQARFEPVRVTDFLDLRLSWNHGVSFSMASHLGAYDRVILGTLALVIALGLVVWIVRGVRPLMLVALGMIIGGAVGNSLDRIRLGAVEDFLFFHVGAFDWWPIFNIADSMICIAAGLMMFDSLFDRSLSHKNTP